MKKKPSKTPREKQLEEDEKIWEKLREGKREEARELLLKTVAKRRNDHV